MSTKTYLVIVKGDVNDADYLYAINNIDEDELPVFKKFAKLLKEQERRHNWDGAWNEEGAHDLYVATGLVSEAEYWCFSDYLPHDSENGRGIHSIKSIRLVKDPEVIDLL